MANKTKILIVLLVLVIVVLAGIMTFSFLIKPKYTGYVVAKQNEGVIYTLSSLLAQLQQQGYVQLPVDAQGHYVVLVPAQQQPGLPQDQQGQAAPGPTA